MASDRAKISYEAAVRVLKELGEAGCGRFLVGRRGGESRLVWDEEIDAKSLAEVALGTAESFWQEDGDCDTPDDRIRHEFQLRPETRIILELPDDLTDAEAERLAGFVRTLPFH